MRMHSPRNSLTIDLGRVVDISKVIVYPYASEENRGRLANVSIVITESDDVPGSLDESQNCAAPRSVTKIKGGLYQATPRRTCGGNANGAPCNVMFSRDPRNGDVINPQCSTDIDPNRTRLACFTNKKLSRWGYCDCEAIVKEQWTRPFGREKASHNTRFRVAKFKCSPMIGTRPWARFRRQLAVAGFSCQHLP